MSASTTMWLVVLAIATAVLVAALVGYVAVNENAMQYGGSNAYTMYSSIYAAAFYVLFAVVAIIAVIMLTRELLGVVGKRRIP